MNLKSDTPSGGRTHTLLFLRQQPLPVGLQEQKIDRRLGMHDPGKIPPLPIAPPGFEPGVFCFKGSDVASYTTGH